MSVSAFPLTCLFSSLHDPRFHKLPDNPGQSDFPSPVRGRSPIDTPYTPRVFLHSSEFKCWPTFTRLAAVYSWAIYHRLHKGVSSSESETLARYGSCCVPRGPLLRKALPLHPRSYDLMCQSCRLPPPSLLHSEVGLCSLDHPLLVVRTFPTLFLRILPWMPGPLPRRVLRCSCPFLPTSHRPSPSRRAGGRLSPTTLCAATSAQCLISGLQSRLAGSGLQVCLSRSAGWQP